MDDPQIIDISDLGSTELGIKDDNLKSTNFGPGIELLMNEKKQKNTSSPKNDGGDSELLDLEKELNDLIGEGRVFISIVPDIESINYGRGVGYDIIEHVPPSDIKKISATKIREELRNEGKL